MGLVISSVHMTLSLRIQGDDNLVIVTPTSKAKHLTFQVLLRLQSPVHKEFPALCFVWHSRSSQRKPGSSGMAAYLTLQQDLLLLIEVSSTFYSRPDATSTFSSIETISNVQCDRSGVSVHIIRV
jgi:hypothetical protein